mmetsp:Transcript_20852/g.47328  ORF Transcript_20852/g.47328 Transcript_20852/m.47328 type:complete len:104 (+) Transcript_20852:1582-1893(+)
MLDIGRDVNKSRAGKEQTTSSLSREINLFNKGLVGGAPSGPLTEAEPSNVAKRHSTFSRGDMLDTGTPAFSCGNGRLEVRTTLFVILNHKSGSSSLQCKSYYH